MRTTSAWRGTGILMMAGGMVLLGCERDPMHVDRIETGGPMFAAVHLPASGTFNQTTITSLDVRLAGPNTILDQTSRGTISGTLSGPFEDDLKVVIHPNGRFNAHFTITCTCTVDGKQGTLELVAGDTGELLSPTLAAFEGRAVIRGGTGDLAGLRGVLRIEGTVNVTTGLATYTYTGDIHFQP